MIKTVKIEGLHCPNCAKKLQNELNKIKGVDNANIDVIKGILTFESNNIDNAINQIIKTTKKIEPNVTIIYENSEKHSNKKLWFDLSCLTLGIILAILCLTISMPAALFWTAFVSSALLLGYQTYYKAFIMLFKGTINENLLLTISVVGAAMLGEYMESLMVIALYSIGKIFEGLAVSKSRKSIEKLTNLQPEYAVILDNNNEIKKDPKDVKIGTIIIVKPGERVPIDGKVVEGSANLNMQSLTGESLPVFVAETEEIMSGAIVLDGALKIVTTKDYNGSTVSKILSLIEHAQSKKSKTETLISKITKWYTLGVIICAAAVFGIVWIITSNPSTAIYRGLIFLVVSCPCAFAISVPLAYFSGIGNASRHGILIKGSNYLDALAKLETIAFDKTGTLTTGNFIIEKINSFNGNYTSDDILYIAALGEQNSLHPLAKSIVNHNHKELKSIKNFKEVAGEGIYFSYLKNNYFVGRKSKELSSTIVEVFENENKIGEIHLVDQIKSSSISACKLLKKMKVKTILLSGDNDETVKKVANEIGISDYYSKLLPEDKFNYIKKQKESSKSTLGYVGDGINDSPSLMLADVGISMGINGSAASIEASDVVLVDDNPEKIISAIKISKYTNKIVWQNIILSALIKFTFLALGTFGITGMLAAVFADVGVTVLAILNSMRALIHSPNKNKLSSRM